MLKQRTLLVQLILDPKTRFVFACTFKLGFSLWERQGFRRKALAREWTSIWTWLVVVGIVVKLIVVKLLMMKKVSNSWRWWWSWKRWLWEIFDNQRWDTSHSFLFFPFIGWKSNLLLDFKDIWEIYWIRTFLSFCYIH